MEYKVELPWRNVTDNGEILNLKKEISREISEKHYLYSKELEIIARRDDEDDLLVKVIGSEQIVELHLTWTGEKEENPQLPSTILYSTFEDWQKSL